jgi:hypothetical protein
MLSRSVTSGLRDLPAEAGQGDGVRLGTAALAGIEPADDRDLVRGELEVGTKPDLSRQGPAGSGTGLALTADGII